MMMVATAPKNQPRNARSTSMFIVPGQEIAKEPYGKQRSLV
jgi:hypothetical protein